MYIIKVQFGKHHKYTEVYTPYNFNDFMLNTCSNAEMFGKELVAHNNVTAHYTDQDGAHGAL